MPEPDTRLCWTCAHRRVCYIKRDAEKAVGEFTGTFQRLDSLHVKGTATYEILHCGEYAAEEAPDA